MSVLIYQHQDKINQICQESGISYLALFGSYARGDFSEKSDIDFLVEFKNTPGLIEFIRVKHQLEDLLNKKVDLVTKKGFSERIKPYVQVDIRQIYG